ncbi:MAG: hypothetical protein IJR36_02665, partial [Lachnospiraceae bacterium]|nr:hypothetical protein [Lachnospiraceae bacterium]
VREMLARLRNERGITIMISSHILDELSKVADAYGIIHEGTLLDEFSAEELHERCGKSLVLRTDNTAETLQVLEDYLDSFEGIVISVSHDRYFLDRTCRRLFAFEEGGRIRQHEGGYSDYRLRVEEESRKEPEEPAAAPEKAAYVRSHTKKKTLSFKDQREYETLPGEIEALEAQSAAIAAQIEQYATDAEKLAALVQEQEELQARLEERMERWLTLEEMAEALKNED